MARRAATSAPSEEGHVVVRVIKTQKNGGQPKSHQLETDSFTGLYGAQARLIEPDIFPERYLEISDENPVHSACLWAVTVDSVGRGWRLVTKTRRMQAKLELQQIKLEEQIASYCSDLTFRELLHQAALELRMVGNSAWEVVRDQRGKIGAIYPLPAHTIRLVRDAENKRDFMFAQLANKSGKLRYFKRFGDTRVISDETGETMASSRNGRVQFAPDRGEAASEVIYFRDYHPMSPSYGRPRWAPGATSLTELGAIREYNLSFFQSGGQTDTIVTVTADSANVAEQVADKIVQQIEDNKGVAHMTIVVSGSSDVTVTIAPLSKVEGAREGQFLHRREDLVKEVLIIHQVPPYRIGWADSGGLSGSGAREMLRAYRMGAVEPLQNILEDRLSATLFNPELGGLSLPAGTRWVLEDVDWDLVDQNLDIAVRGVQNGILTPAQATTLLGFEASDEEWANELYYDGVPLRLAAEAATAGDAALPEGFRPARVTGKKPKPGKLGKPGKKVPGTPEQVAASVRKMSPSDRRFLKRLIRNEFREPMRLLKSVPREMRA